jgi:hypothetical protein
MILAAVSGGLDSVAMLYRLLTTAADPIHVHHISIRAVTGRWKAEGQAMALIVPWLQTHARPFGYTTAIYPPPLRRPDISIVSDECARMIKAGLIPMPAALARGANWHDMRSKGTGTRQRSAAMRWQLALGPKAPPIIFPIADMKRRALWAMLPPQLAVLTASCRRPRVREGVWHACGGCQTCDQLRREGVPLERALTAEGKAA